MAVGDIYRIFVAFGDTQQGKERYTVEVGHVKLGLVVLDSITSKYTNKSEFIKNNIIQSKIGGRQGYKSRPT